jgi:hypothetical protein
MVARLISVSDDTKLSDLHGAAPPECCGGPHGYRLMLKRHQQGATVSDPALVEAMIQLLSATHPEQPASTWNLLRDAVRDSGGRADSPLALHRSTFLRRMFEPDDIIWIGEVWHSGEKRPQNANHFRTLEECPVFMEELAWLTRAPRCIKRLFFALVDVLVWERVRRRLNAFRGGIGLPPLQSFSHDALHGAEGVAALFPRWFAAPQPDWPARVRQFGFPIVSKARPLSDSLENFLKSGEPPLVWTHGSANFDIGHFQSRALEVSRELNLRCLLISLDAPAAVSDNALHVAHARFEDLFPRCKAVVHHGGIGTTAKCIAAGVPQLIIPRWHDQPDNAQRIVKLGLGKALSYRHTNTARLATTLRQLLASATISHRCREFQQRVLKTDTLSDVLDGPSRLQRSRANDEAFHGRVNRK